MSWENRGNVGTNAATDFLGTADAQPLVIRTNNKEALRVGVDSKIGVGTVSPASKLEIAGDWDGNEGALGLTGDKPTIKFAGGAAAGNANWILHLGSRGPGNISFMKQTAPGVFDAVMTFSRSGNVLDPAAEIVGNWNGQEGALRLTGDKPTIKFAGGAVAGNATWILHLGSHGPGNLEFMTQTAPGVFTEVLSLSRSGNMGIGTSTPTSKLHVAGGMVVRDDISLANGDCAEEFEIAVGSSFEPGTVMVLHDECILRESAHAYDKSVAGVIAGAGSYKPGIVLDRNGQGNRVPVALLGKVFCKADAQFGSIGVGDLLTTSPTPGYAMRVDDHRQAFGSVIGKALRPLNEGQGLIPILIALQ